MYYEYLLKKLLCNQRIRYNREFYNVDLETIIEIYEGFNQINSILNTEEKLYDYIKHNDPNYYSKIINKKIIIESISSSNNEIKLDKQKKRKGIYIDTSNL